MNTPQSHINNTLQACSRYSLSDDEIKNIQEHGIEEFIYSKLASKKFRKSKLQQTCEIRTKKAIDICVKHNKPIHVVYFTGGYKLWRFPTSPEADWAEFFNIAHVLRYIAPIAAAYKSGVTISYYIHTLLMEKHDNLTIEEIEKYINSFQMIINAFLKFTPLNISIKIWKDADLYGRSEYFPILEKGYNEAEKLFLAMTEAQKNHYLKLGRLNIKWDGKEDWTKLSPAEKEEKVRQGAIWELAATSNLSRIHLTAKGEDKILLFTFNTPAFIGIGSTQGSVVKHWTGFGVLEQDGEIYRERILSPSQFEKVKNDIHTVIPTYLLPLKNLESVWVYPQPFNFTHPEEM